jgi:glycosyltransferase involved in cell wall biosynthesis
MTRVLLAINDLPFLLSHRLPILTALRASKLTVAVAAPTQAKANAILGNMGIDTFDWPLTRSGLHPLREADCVLRLASIYRRWRPAVVHHVTPKPVLYGSLAARLTGIPRVINAISGLGYMFSNVEQRNRLLHRAALVSHQIAHASDGTRVIFQNPDDRAVLVNRGLVPIERTYLIPGSGVDPTAWQPVETLCSAPVVTVACRMLFDKGVADAVAAAKMLRAKSQDIDLHLAGGFDPGSPRAIPESTLQQWHADGSARWLGQVDSMAIQWRQSRIACLPSYYGEGIPKALIEAASCGLPIVTCDVPGCREIVRHGDNGLLVPPRNPQALAEALKTLLNDYDLCVRMGRRGRERVIAEFSLDRVVRQHLDIYRELLGDLWPDHVDS